MLKRWLEKFLIAVDVTDILTNTKLLTLAMQRLSELKL